MITPVSAHVTVKPSKVNIGTFQTFVIAVPVEKEIPTVSIRLIIPDELRQVSPNQKPGWNIELKEKDAAKEEVILVEKSDQRIYF